MFPVGMMKEEVIEVVDPVLELLSTPVTLLAAHDSDRSFDGGKKSEGRSRGEHEVTRMADQIPFNQTVTENNAYDWLVGGCCSIKWVGIESLPPPPPIALPKVCNLTAISCSRPS